MISTWLPVRGRPRIGIRPVPGAPVALVTALTTVVAVPTANAAVPPVPAGWSQALADDFDGPANSLPSSGKDRSTVERAISKLKQFRAGATRYDKRSYKYLATIDVATIKIWLRDLATDPRDTAEPRYPIHAPAGGVRHRLAVVVTGAICAVVAGSRSYTVIAEWVADLPAVAAMLLGIDTDRRPTEVTIRRLLQAINPDLLAAVTGAWLTGTIPPLAPGSR